jgi:hypothetical protein
VAGTSRIPATAVSLIPGLMTFGTVRSAVRNADPIRTTTQASAAVDATSAMAIVGGLMRIRRRWVRLPRWIGLQR